MKRAPAPRRIAGLGLSCALLWTAVGTTAAMAQTAVPPELPATLNAVDFNFVGQANLGAPFQVEFGTIGRSQGTTRSYAHLMVTRHIPVDAFTLISAEHHG